MRFLWCMPDDLSYPEVDPNKKTALEYWSGRYGATQNYLFGKEPALSVKNHVAVLRKGKALDVAMGEGRNAVFLASKGFTVEGVDCVPKAVERANSLAQEKQVTIEAKTQNLDFFLMPLMKYDTIVMTYFKPQQRFFSEVRRGLVQGGTFLFEAYLSDHVRENPNSGIDLNECYKPGEVLGLLRDFRVLFYQELPEGKNHTVQAIVKKV